MLASNFLVPNSTFVVELLAFLLVLGVLAKWVVPVINKNMEERQATIKQALVDAEQAKVRAAEAETEYRRVIDEARTEARGLVDEANRLAEQLRSDKRQQAEREYEQIVSLARSDIDSESRRASEELRQEIADLVIAVVQRVIGESMTEDAHRRLIDRTIAEVEAEGAGTGVTA